MTELVYLVITDGLYGKLLFDKLKVCFGCRKCRNTAAREADLGCGAEFVDHIRISCFFALT